MTFRSALLSASVLLAAGPASAGTTQYLARGAGSLAYDDQGSGPLVLCVPGMGDVRQQYRFLTPRLVEAGFRVVTVDLRGHGESGTAGTDFSVAGVGADLAALLDHLGAGPARIVGNSMAAGAAVWLAAERPELVNRLVLVAPFVRSEPTWWSNLLYSVLFGGFWGADAWVAYYSGLYPTKPPSDFAEYKAHLKANLAEPGRLEVLRAMLYASKSASESRLDRVSAPTLVVMGTKDPDFAHPEVEAQWVAQRLGGEVRLIEGAGHYPHVEFVDETAPLITEFLSR